MHIWWPTINIGNHIQQKTCLGQIHLDLNLVHKYLYHYLELSDPIKSDIAFNIIQDHWCWFKHYFSGFWFNGFSHEMTNLLKKIAFVTICKASVRVFTFPFKIIIYWLCILIVFPSSFISSSKWGLANVVRVTSDI